MALSQIQSCVKVLARDIVHVAQSTQILSQKSFRAVHRCLHSSMCKGHGHYVDNSFMRSRSRPQTHRQVAVREWRRASAVGLCQMRTYSTAPKERKTTRILTGKLNVAKKRLKTQKLKDDMNAAAYVVGSTINLHKLKQRLKEEELYEVIVLPRDIKNAVMATAIYKVDSKVRDVFFFSDGRVGCWNMPENERLEILKTVLQCTEEPFSLEAILEEEETQPVEYDRVTQFANSTIYLKMLEDHSFEDCIALQKFAFSDGMGQTVVLSFCEKKLDAFTDKIEPEMQKLRDGRPSRMAINDVNKNRGEVFLLRHEINLESDLLDTPDLYWEREDLEGLYKALLDYYNIRLRILVFNERLNYCSDFLELLSNQHNDAKHVFLEKVIIVLIMIEVIFGGVPFLQSYFPWLFPFGAQTTTQEIQSEKTEIDNLVERTTV